MSIKENILNKLGNRGNVLPVILSTQVIPFSKNKFRIKLYDNFSKYSLAISKKKYKNEVFIAIPDITVDDILHLNFNKNFPKIFNILFKAKIVEKGIENDFKDNVTEVELIIGQRYKLNKVLSKNNPILVDATYFPIIEEDVKESDLSMIVNSIRDYFDITKKHFNNIPIELLFPNTNDPFEVIGKGLNIVRAPLTDKFEILNLESIALQVKKFQEYLFSYIESIKIEKQIETELRDKFEKERKQAILREKLNLIEKQLGNTDDELSFYLKKLEGKNPPEEVINKIKDEVKHLKKMPKYMQESVVIRNYLDWLTSLPWGVYSSKKVSITQAEEILEKNHYGLKEVKERILEYIAIKSLNKDLKGPILCLVGPPGTGKTSLGISIAQSLKREYVRISLGGVKDESEIRGHRRTYVGAMPGKIISAMKRVKVMDPVFILDEIDKMSSSFSGDPASALLEVLDPQQNSNFVDHYINLPFDLSKVLFITTANSKWNIPLPLLDRMEIIELNSYSINDKLNIATKYLIPKQIKENGLSNYNICFTKQAIEHIISEYTLEPGVRELERKIGTILRKIAVNILKDKEKSIETKNKELKEDKKKNLEAKDKELKKGKEENNLKGNNNLNKDIDIDKISIDKKVKISKNDVENFLGPELIPKDYKKYENDVGLVMGLAWTYFGGDILPIEVLLLPGNGQVILTGQLGDVMKESVKIALTLARKYSSKFDIPEKFHEKLDIHIHFPEGAVPKDGPSAGVTILTAVISALTKISCKKDLAMTGEITLSGKVLAVGGLIEKLAAASRERITNVLIPASNKSILKKIPKDILKTINVDFVSSTDELLDKAFENLPLKKKKKTKSKAKKEDKSKANKITKKKSDNKQNKGSKNNSNIKQNKET